MTNDPTTTSAPPSFGDFAVTHLSATHWHNSLPVPAGVLREAADAYLFRFDKSLSASFVRHRLHTASAALAACTGARPGPTSRWLRRALAEASAAYFGSRWGLASALVAANLPALERLRRRYVRLNELVSPESDVTSLAPQAVLPLVSAGRPVVLNVYAQYCSKCAHMAPAFAEAARRVGSSAFFAAVDAGVHPEVRHMFNVESYPTVMLLRDGSDTVYFPGNVEHSVANLEAFALGERMDAQPQNGFVANVSGSRVHEGNGVAPVSNAHSQDAPRGRRRASGQLGQWAAMLERQGIDELDALVRDRDIVVHMRIDAAIQCGETSCAILPTRSTESLPPLCALLGGGMGAGKTTAVSAVAGTPFWRAYGANVVVVEADAFKLSDPFFHVLRAGAVTPTAERVVHEYSIAAAETLFLTAVNKRRDVVFDGTLSWAEYARQTVAMLRDGEFEYERGPGYVVRGDGSVEELYWKRARRRKVPVQPYRVELVAVTVDAATAVARGIVRQILEGRGVPVADQLQSHALFSNHFESYVRLVDSAYLFDMTDSQQCKAVGEGEEGRDDDRSTTAEIIAMRPGVLFSTDGEALDINAVPSMKPFRVQNSAAYSRFLRKKFINVHAKQARELYEGAESTVLEKKL